MEIGVNGICVTLESNSILEDINMDIKNKEFIGIIGPNGSGKSTLLKCIYRVLKPQGGTISLDDVLLEHMKVKESAKKMAVVAQHSHYSFDFCVQEVVLMGRTPHKRRLERDNAEDYCIVREALKKVNMEEFAERSFSTLSGGEQQRIILARALAQQTECLILDEPTNHLDVKYQLQLMDIVKQLDLTVVAAIHDLNIAAMYCDKIYVIKKGKVIAYGTPKEVLTKTFIREVYDVEVEVIENKKTGLNHILYQPGYCL